MITIQNNGEEKRILILDSPFPLDESHDFPEHLFDAVFVLCRTPEETKTVLTNINPVSSAKCCYKPLFVAADMRGKMGSYDEIIDGYADDWNDPDVMATTRDIIEYNTLIGLNAQEEPLLTGSQFLIRLTRYLISRKRYVLEAQIDEHFPSAYGIPVFHLFFTLGAFEPSDMHVFLQSMVEKGLFRPVKFLNRLQLCPKCLHSHLLYLQVCPRCGQSAIQSEEVIHHFRCGNATPEHTYNFGGQLQCPKCKQILKHVGVDFDRPTHIHTCSTCGNTFVEAKTQVLCTNCKTTLRPDELIPQDYHILEITAEGRQSIVSPSIGFTVYTEFYDNYIDYNRFVNRMRLLAEQKYSGNIRGDLLVGKIWVLNDEGVTQPIRPEGIELACLYFPHNKVSAANNIIYIGSLIHNYRKGDTEEEIINFQVMLAETIRAAQKNLRPGERICCTHMKLQGNRTTIDDFVKDMEFVAHNPDDSVSYTPSAEA